MTTPKQSARKPADYPFCRQPWHIGAMLLGFGFVFTVVWSFHLLHDLDDELAMLRFGKSSSDRASDSPDHARSPDHAGPSVRAQAGVPVRAQGGAPVQDQQVVPAAMNQLVAAPLPGMMPVVGPVPAGQQVGGGMMDPAVAWRVRAALVSIAGMRSVDGVAPPEFMTAGSGVLVTANGHVATAAHVSDGLEEILVRVQTPSGPRQYTAQLVKSAPSHDLAILKLVSRDLFPYAPLAPETLVLKPGDAVVAWGDPNGAHALVNRGYITQVEVSATLGGRSLTHMVQTDAVSHWSQSGGPLVDDQGRVVGINVVAQSASGVIGYALPSDVLLAHFQDVVTFPVPPSTANAMAPAPGMNAAGTVTRPVAMRRHAGNGPGRLGRTVRPADDWWAQARAEFGASGGGSTGMATSPPFTDMGVHVAARYLQPTMVPVVHASEQRYGGYSLETLLGLLALGLISGISGGMMTMGGGIIKVTGLLLFFGYGMLLIRPVAYITNIFLYGAAVLRYRKYDLILWPSVRAMIPWAMFGVVLGYFVGNAAGTPFVRYLLGVFAALVGVRMLVEIMTGCEKKSPSEETRPPGQAKEKPATAILRYLGIGPLSEKDHPGNHRGFLGLPMGIISGILGITGGVVEVPLQRYVVGVPLRNAIANSAVLVFFASLVGSIVAMAHGVQTGAFEWSTPLKLAVILIPGAYVGGLIGAWLTNVVPVGVLRWFYAVLMFVIAVRMFLS